MNDTISVAAGKIGDKLVETLQALPEQLHDLQNLTEHKARNAVCRADKAVHRHPYGVIGVAAAAGLIIGLLVSRR